MDSIQTALVCTYADLRRTHSDRLQAEHKSPQQIRNHNSALNQFIRHVGKTDTCPCEADFTDNFDDRLSSFAEALAAKGTSPAAISNIISCLRSIQVTFRGMEADSDSLGFHEVLRSLIASSGLSVREITQKAGIPERTLRTWISGHHAPYGKPSVINVHKLEQFFGVPQGHLLRKVSINENKELTVHIESRQRHIALTSKPYRYKNPSGSIRTEWSELLHFYTAPYLMNGLVRNVTWRVKDKDRISSNVGWEAETPYGICVSAHITWKNIAGFFGFLLNSEDQVRHKVEDKDISLALLSDSQLVISYIEFKRRRSGKYTGEIPRILAFILSVLREKTGYLRQNPCFGQRLLVPVSPSEWPAWCDKNRQILLRVYSELKNGLHIQKGRDPQEPISLILAEPNPIHALIHLVERMEKRAKLTQAEAFRAIKKRDILLVKMLISNPLRVHHYSIMTYTNDNRGNLYQDASGAWRLRFSPEDFKNQRGAASKEYDVTLAPWVYQDIVEYLNVYRRFLANALESERVFLPSKTRAENYTYWSPVSINRCMHMLTREYIPDSPGFGPHAFRHIIATDYIRNNPSGYQVAANILHDKLETVLREYAHVKVADGFSHWTAYLETQVSAARRADHE